MEMGISENQIFAIEVTERLGSVLSLIGTAFIIGTFLYDNAFHKPINRLVFYASWGNIMANVGTLISRSGIDLGINQPLCQFQAFLIQMYDLSKKGYVPPTDSYLSGSCPLMLYGHLPWRAMSILPSSVNIMLNSFELWNGNT